MRTRAAQATPTAKATPSELLHGITMRIQTRRPMKMVVPTMYPIEIKTKKQSNVVDQKRSDTLFICSYSVSTQFLRTRAGSFEGADCEGKR